ncbi:MAG: response regulator [Desulfomonilaceae bacterium]|nr:response regulator [Desulfomonilaceae bacterium]
MNDPKVLLVDDEKDFVCTLAERLELRDIKVDVAFNGTEAIEKIEKHQPQLVVLDLLMPGMPGLDVLRWIEKRHPDTEVIVLTGHGEQECKDEALRLGADCCLLKPISIEKLIDKMMKALTSSKPKNQ